MQWIQAFLEKYPELALYLAIALGYLIGGVKFGKFGLGPVTGSPLSSWAGSSGCWSRSPVGGMKISLSTSGGTPLMGLLVGYLRIHHPLLKRIPDGAVNPMTGLGLAAFVGMTGLHSGPVSFSAVSEAGIGLLFGGMLVAAL